jgi:magnesium transporter
MPETENESFRFLFFSDLLGKKVVGGDGAVLGKVADLVIATGEPYPPVESLVVRSRHGPLQFPWSAVAALNGELRLRPEAQAAAPPEAPVADRIRLAEEVLDRQIVDIGGAKLVRVNDLHFLEVKGALRVTHVDIGLRGLVRRLGWQRPVDLLVRIVKPRAPYLAKESFLSWKLVQPIESAPGRVRVEVTQKALASLHPADLAEILEELGRSNRKRLFGRLDVETAAEALEEAPAEVITELLGAVPPEKAADILEEMAPDEAADALSELPGERRAELLQAMEKPEATEVAELLEYPARSAGGLMTPDLLELRPEATVADALAEVRRRAEELPIIYDVFVVDTGGVLKGVCTLKDLVVAGDPATSLERIMREAPATVTADAGLKEVARAASKYNLVSVPVVDLAGALMGIVTVDDILAEVVDVR